MKFAISLLLIPLADSETCDLTSAWEQGGEEPCNSNDIYRTDIKRALLGIKWVDHECDRLVSLINQVCQGRDSEIVFAAMMGKLGETSAGHTAQAVEIYQAVKTLAAIVDPKLLILGLLEANANGEYFGSLMKGIVKFASSFQTRDIKRPFPPKLVLVETLSVFSYGEQSASSQILLNVDDIPWLLMFLETLDRVSTFFSVPLWRDGTNEKFINFFAVEPNTDILNSLYVYHAIGVFSIDPSFQSTVEKAIDKILLLIKAGSDYQLISKQLIKTAIAMHSAFISIEKMKKQFI
jgi:hypothetical protein